VARLAIWLLGGTYLGVATFSGYYPIATPVYLGFFGIFLALSIGLLLDVQRRPHRKGRRVVALFIDLVATSLAVYLTNGATSPFFLLYIWIIIAYGTRYGSRFLFLAALSGALLYVAVLTALNAWHRNAYEAVFQLVAIFLIPLYLTRLLRNLHEARIAADAASRAKSEFLANVSHEIRTPLHGALGMVSLLEHTPLSREQQDYVGSLRSCAQVLRTLLDDVLDFSKIEAGQLRLEKQPFRIADVVQEVMQLLDPLAREKGLQMTIQLPEPLPGPVRGDALRLRQVLLNLVGNAIKFTEAGGVTVRVATRPGPPDRLAVRFSVVDTGIGIPADQLPFIFESFHQVQRSAARVHGGTGLGTSIAKRLVETMGGRIGVDTDLGKGSTFWFDLDWPLVPPESAARPEAPDRPSRRLAEVQGQRILLAEDSAIGAKAVTTMLNKAGFAVDVVKDGAEALERLRSDTYALVLMDLHMPVMGGLEVTQRWRELEQGRRGVPIVALTANVTAEDRTRCLQAGMNDFLAKPVDAARLLSTIERYLGPTAPDA
jgi:two-component system sensor histidine kinase RpfC